MRKITYLLFFVISVLNSFSCSRSNHGESPVIKEFKKSGAIQHAYYCYPSTLRMINLDDSPEINAAIKGIRRLTLFNLWPAQFSIDDQFALSEKLQEQDGFTIMAEMDSQDQTLLLLGRNEGTETVAFIHSEEMTGMAHLLGSVNFLELLKLYNAVRDGENESLSGVRSFFDLMTEDKKNAASRRKYRREWEERQVKEKAKRDSMEQASLVDSTAVKE